MVMDYNGHKGILSHAEWYKLIEQSVVLQFQDDFCAINTQAYQNGVIN